MRRLTNLQKTDDIKEAVVMIRRTDLDDKKYTVVTTPLLKKTLLTNEKVTTSEDFEKGPKQLDDNKEKVGKTPSSKKQLLTTVRVTTSEEVEEVTKKLDDMR